MKITKMDIRTFVNITEDLEKVFQAINNILPESSIKTILFTQKKLDGHYGNQIILLETRIKNKETLKTIFHKIRLKLNEQDKKYLEKKGNQHIEKGKLFIRIDKQSAYLNEIKLGSSDPIHLKIYFKKSRDEKTTDIYQKIWDE